MLWSFGQVCTTMVHPGMRTSSIFNTQHVAARGWPNARNMLRPTMSPYVVLKCWDGLAGACKCWVHNVGICCVDGDRLAGA